MNELAVLLKIQEVFRNIEQKARGGTIFGMPVDVDDPAMLVVAAYYMGKADEQFERTQINDASRIKNLWREQVN